MNNFVIVILWKMFKTEWVVS